MRMVQIIRRGDRETKKNKRNTSAGASVCRHPSPNTPKIIHVYPHILPLNDRSPLE